MNYKAGFVAVVGRPNVGKSTLINALLKQKIAAVSPKPQTTRRTQLGILSMESAQIIFIDTPGIHKPVHKLGEYMNEAAAETLKDADIILWLVDASAPPNEEDQIVAARLAEAPKDTPILLALNKVDLISGEALDARQAAYQALLPTAKALRLSALSGYEIERLKQEMTARLPEGEAFYSEDQITDLYEREIATELIREAALLHLRDEVPHSIAVRMDEYQERGERGAYIRATLLVERDSQKGIVIGKSGEMLKAIGSTARREIESMSGRKVFLELRVKVQKNWRNTPEGLRAFGFSRDKGTK
jgi:GTP-binding protein Era